MGRNLTIFNKDHDTAEEGRSQVRQKQSSCSEAYGFATITMYSWWRFGEPAYCSENMFLPEGGAPKFQIRYAYPISLVIVANGCGYTQGPFWLPWGIILVG